MSRGIAGCSWSDRVKPGLAKPIFSAALLVTYALLGMLLFSAVWDSPGEKLIGVGRDTYLFTWFISWPAFALTHGINPLYSNYIDWPAGINLMWNTSILLPATLLAPITLRFGPLVSYNILTTLAPALSAWSAYFLIRRFVEGFWPAAVGGLVYGFSPFIIAQSLQHPAFTFAPLPPLMLMLVDDIIRLGRPVIPAGALLGVLASAQVFISEEFLALTAIAVFLELVILGSRRPLALPVVTRVLQSLGIALMFFLLFAGYPLAYQFLGPLQPHGELHPPNLFVNDVLSFVVPTRNQWLAPSFATAISDRFIGGRLQEVGAYIGIPLLVLLGVVVVRMWHDLRVRAAALIATVLGILSLGYTIHVGGHTSRVPVVILGLVFLALARFLPGWTLFLLTTAGWLALWRAPLLRDLLPSRFSVLIALGVGFVLAVYVERVQQSEGRQRALGAVAAAVALLPLFPLTPFPSTPASVPEFFRSAALKDIPSGSVALIAPFAGLHHESPMLWQAAAQFWYRMPEGYAFTPGPEKDQVNPPPTFTRNLLWAIEAGSEDGSVSPIEQGKVLADLKRWQVRSVIVGPMPHEDGAVSLFTQVLGRSPTMSGGVWLWTGL